MSIPGHSERRAARSSGSTFGRRDDGSKETSHGRNEEQRHEVKRMKRFSVGCLFLSCSVFAAEPDVTSLYEVHGGAPKSLKAGERGKVVIEIKAKNGAHVSDEAPLRIDLTAKELSLEKEKLTLADSLTKKAAGSVVFPDPKFEVGLTGAAAGNGIVEAKMVFFICTEKVCARQSKTLSFPVTIQ
jgi:hypothetical protein